MKFKFLKTWLVKRKELSDINFTHRWPMRPLQQDDIIIIRHRTNKTKHKVIVYCFKQHEIVGRILVGKHRVKVKLWYSDYLGLEDFPLDCYDILKQVNKF